MHLNLVIISICFVALLISMGGGTATDTLSRGQSLTGNQTLISKNRMFELGFFQPNPTSQNRFYYLSIRYTELQDKTIVWTANRDKPLPNRAASKLQIAAGNGDLELHHNGSINPLWSTTTSLTPSPSSVSLFAVLGDNGNLILRDGSGMYWQSFDHPTNTWLPGATLGSGKRLVSWKSDDDPSPGLYSAEIISEDGASQIVLRWNESTTAYWLSGRYIHGRFEFADKLSQFLNFQVPKNQNYLIFQTKISVFIADHSTPVQSMLVLDHGSGALRLLTWWPGSSFGSWDPSFETTGFVLCGANEYGVQSSSSCLCLQGFTRLDGSNTCSRKSPLECGEKKSSNVFVEILEMKFPDDAVLFLGDDDAASSEEECELACLNSCSCTAYAVNQSGCFIWKGDLLGLQKEVSSQQKLHLKLANSHIPKGKTKTFEVIIAVVVPVIVLVSGTFLGFFYNKRMTKHKENKKPGEDLLSFDFNTNVQDGPDSSTRNDTEFDLPMFSYASVSAATNNFSPQNKLGEGGFGPVYKGTLLNGQEIALKRLSQKSGQGFEEFRNEILLIAKLQHRNLVRLLGCCIDPNESILIYEYMPNKSLDCFLFGTDKQYTLDWKTRIRIIEGIVQGLLYLHEYSRVRIIHRDLKASNILLDDEMNPKISDFGMARIFGGGNDSQAHTNKVSGTFGYIAPEYAMEGLFSTKSDVYSFGVLVLEIISGRKNTGFYNTDSLNLLGHAWDLWISDRGVELVDEKVGYPAASTALRYINVGLLCVQGNPNNRPNMSSVVSMISNEIAALPPPQKPAYSTKSWISSTSSVKNSGGSEPYPSFNDLTVSVVNPR